MALRSTSFRHRWISSPLSDNVASKALEFLPGSREARFAPSGKASSDPCIRSPARFDVSLDRKNGELDWDVSVPSESSFRDSVAVTPPVVIDAACPRSSYDIFVVEPPESTVEIGSPRVVSQLAKDLLVVDVLTGA